jgi:tRNA(fMet)-specific endonuclease VapC
MRARYLLDTDICVYIHRRQPAHVLARFQHLNPGEAVLSVISFGELVCGAEKSRWRTESLQRLNEFAGLVQVMSLPAEAALRYGLIRADLERRGEIIGSNDLWIAAHALLAELTLITNNEREFGRVEGLKIENWTRPPGDAGQ